MINENKTTKTEKLFAGGGEMGERIQSYDWARSPLGTVGSWSENLKVMVRLMLTSGQPMFIWWGEDLIQLYNEAYKMLLGDKDPSAFGQSAVSVWQELWEQVGPRVESIFLDSGGNNGLVSAVCERNQYLEETYFQLSLNPIKDEQGEVKGIWGIQTDQTQRVIGERQSMLLHRLAIPPEELTTPIEACMWSLACLSTNSQDFPFALIYGREETEGYWSLLESYGLEPGQSLAPPTIAWEDQSLWPFSQAIAAQQPYIVSLLDNRSEPCSKGAWPIPPHQAVVIPLAQSHQISTLPCLVAGLNPFRHLDGNYRQFIDRVAAQISAHLIHAQAQANLKLVRMRQPTSRQEQLLGRERLANLLNQVDDEFMMFDQDWRYIYVNQRAEQIAGYSRQELLGQSMWEIFPDLKDSQFHQELQQALTEQKIRRFEHYYEAWDCWYEHRVYPSPEGIALFCTNITERKQAELTLTQTTELLKKRNQELDRFAHIVSHDLKAPLRAIANLSQWLEEDLVDRLPPDNQQQLQLLRQRVYRMESLINSLLEYSRADRTQVDVERVAVEQLLSEVIDSISPPPGFTILVHPPMPTLTAKRVLLSQVFANLIGNAIKHHDQTIGKIEVLAVKHTDCYQFTVKDDGPGISGEYHEKIFGIFQTLKTHNSQENTGIGLSIVKKIIDTEGGNVWVESALGEGTAFHFTWPRQGSIGAPSFLGDR
ncbi:MAG: ATP-binding protein [Snowella sp.]|nr:ATP-binding protein [Snowella sp.]